MRVTWMGHGSFRIEAAGQVLLLDPWVDGNPVFPVDQTDAAIEGATAILLTHGHFDHTKDCVDIAKKTGALLYGMYELINWFGAMDGVEGNGFNRGGTHQIAHAAHQLHIATANRAAQEHQEKRHKRDRKPDQAVHHPVPAPRCKAECQPNGPHRIGQQVGDPVIPDVEKGGDRDQQN